jgi:hypothetical protein
MLSIIFLASRISIFNYTRGREWLQLLKACKRIGDYLAGFE